MKDKLPDCCRNCPFLPSDLYRVKRVTVDASNLPISDLVLCPIEVVQNNKAAGISGKCKRNYSISVIGIDPNRDSWHL